MIREPQYKVARRVGERIFPKTQTPKYTNSLARKGASFKRGRPKSEYGRQLLEKQKTKLMYGISERQFSKYVKAAQKKVGVNSVAELNKSLETRLDNVVYRAGIATSRAAARQMVSHGHFLVGGIRINIPSYQLKPNDKIILRKQDHDKQIFANVKAKLKSQAASASKQSKWFKIDPDNLEIEILTIPQANDSEQILNLGSVIEFYSRA